MGFENTQGMTEPQVVEEVAKQIKSLGDNSKANHEKLCRQYEEMKGVIDKLGPNYDGKMDKVRADVKEQLEKMSTDIVTRQQALDDSMTQRMDKVECAMKRVGYGPKGTEGVYTEEKEARDFFFSKMALSPSQEKGITPVDVEKMKVDVDAYKAYKSAFDKHLRVDEKLMSMEEYKALSVGKGPDGGYLVTPAMATTIYERMFESDPVRQLCNVETISTGALEILVDWGDIGWDWEAETVANDESDTPQWKKKLIYVHVGSTRPRASMTLVEDSAINLEAWLSKKISNRAARGQGAAFVSGDGVGKPRGFLTYSNGTDWNTIEQVAMGAAAALTADGFYSVKYSLKEDYLGRASWLMNRTTVMAAMKLKGGDGHYIWQPSLKEGQPSILAGSPLRMSTSMSAVAANALSVAIADWPEAYSIVDRLGITIQKDPYSHKPMIEYYTRLRTGGDVVNFDAIKLGIIST